MMMSAQTPEQLLELILDSDKGQQLKMCKLALDASSAAEQCFRDGHAIEIDNLDRHITALSVALVDLANGKAIDPGLYKTALDRATTVVVESA